MNEGNQTTKGLPAVTALVVEPTLADTLFVVSTLSPAGYRVTVADFREAKALLSIRPPHLLVVDVCQGEFNGLQLVIRGQAARARLAALVTCRYEDIVLQRETESLGGTFVVKPIARSELLAAAVRTVWRGFGERDGHPVRPPFERRRCERRQAPVVPAGLVDRRQSERRRAAKAV